MQTWNAGAQLLKGYSAEEIIGQHFSKFYPPEALARDFPAEELRRATADGRFEDEGWRVRKDGTLFWANVVITALRDASGSLRGFGKVTRDLTARRDHEESLRQSEERFRLLVEGVRDYAIFMLDANGYVVTWNAGAEAIKGYKAPEIIGRHFSAFYPDDVVKSGWPEHELQMAATEGRFVDEGLRLRKDGSKFWANVTITPLRGEDGRLRGFAKLTRDLTERRRTEALEASGAQREQLLEAERAARIAAQQAARIKDEFLATLSHELRTPLNSILGWAQVLKVQSPLKPEDVRRGTEVIERNARAQAQLVDDLIDMSRVMSGRLRLDVQELSLMEVVRTACESIEPTAQTRGIRLETVLDPRGGVVSGDPGRLQQIFWNLLTNAVKFTPKGGKIQVVLQRVNSHLEVSVSDTGCGISLDFLPRIFERFSQEDGSAARRHGGLGLGLAISKHLVELHGGSIHAKSMGENQGSTFVVNLPIMLGAKESSARRVHPTHDSVEDGQTPVPSLKGIRALLVDDEPDALDLARRVLEAQGVSVTCASSADEALKMLATSKPDVIISDIGMPGMDGFQLMRQVRSTETGKKVSALALTAFARPDDRKRSILAGYQAHLSKPFDVTEFAIVVAGLVGRT